MSEPTRRGLLIILSSPSGAGKSTLATRLREWDRDIEFSISATTRTPRDGEANGKEYYFHDRKTFKTLVSEEKCLNMPKFLVILWQPRTTSKRCHSIGQGCFV